MKGNLQGQDWIQGTKTGWCDIPRQQVQEANRIPGIGTVKKENGVIELIENWSGEDKGNYSHGNMQPL